MLITINITVEAQNTINTLTVDKITYEQYLAGNWKGLIQTGKVALKHDIDFYYLQIRMGIAYYNLKKYRLAVKYLAKARKADRKNDLLNEYLYYAYLNSGRVMDAEKLKEDFYLPLKRKLHIDHDPTFDALTFDVRFENNEDYHAKVDSTDFLTQSVRKGYSYFSLGAEHLSGANKIYYNYGRIKKEVDLYYTDSLESGFFEQKYDAAQTIQNQFYFSYSNQIKYGLNFTSAFNWIYVTTRYDSLFYKTNAHYVAAFFSLYKDFTHFKGGTYVSIANLEKYLQIQPGIDLTWYPLANTNLYFMLNTGYQYENIDTLHQNRFILKSGIGFRVKNVYLEPSYTYGDIKNYIEGSGFIINNDNDVIKDRFELLTYGFFLKGKLNLFFKYQHYNKKNTYWINEIEKNITYKNNTYTMGITWRF